MVFPQCVLILYRRVLNSNIGRQHCSFANPQKILTGPQYEIHGRGWGSFDISLYVVLKPGHCWGSEDARPVPGEQQRRMLPLFWELDFERPLSQTSKTVTLRSVNRVGVAT